MLVGVAQVREIEFIANNPGDWIIHCHMFHHMMNSMSSQAGPLIRNNSTPKQLRVRGYPQVMLGMQGPSMVGMDMPGMDMPKKPAPKANGGMEDIDRIEGRREAFGMRSGWSMGVEGLSTIIRVLPPDLFDRIMGADPHEGMKMDNMDMKNDNMQMKDMKMDGDKQK